MVQLDTILQRVLPIVHAPFLQISEALNPDYAPSAVLANLLSSSCTPLYTTMIVLPHSCKSILPQLTALEPSANLTCLANRVITFLRTSGTSRADCPLGIFIISTHTDRARRHRLSERTHPPHRDPPHRRSGPPRPRTRPPHAFPAPLTPSPSLALALTRTSPQTLPLAPTPRLPRRTLGFQALHRPSPAHRALQVPRDARAAPRRGRRALPALARGRARRRARARRRYDCRRRAHAEVGWECAWDLGRGQARVGQGAVGGRVGRLALAGRRGAPAPPAREHGVQGRAAGHASPEDARRADAGRRGRGREERERAPVRARPVLRPAAPPLALRLLALAPRAPAHAPRAVPRIFVVVVVLFCSHQGPRGPAEW